MILSMLNNGITYLTRQQQNRDRLVIANFALGANSNYTVNPNALSFVSGELYRSSIDAYSISIDTITFNCIIPAGTNLTFGEVAVLGVDGTYLGMYVMTAPISTSGTETHIVLTLTYTGLGTQVTLVTDRTSLAYTRPDYNDALTQLTASALTKPTFKGLVTNETGNTLLELMAGVVDFDSMMFESAYQETFPDMAKLDSSQYAIQTMLRNRLTRQLPATGTVVLTRTSSAIAETIPAFTSFSANGVTLFNRSAVTFAAGTLSLSISVYVGTIQVLNLGGKGSDFQFFTSNEQGFTVSDIDVQVFLGSTPIPIVQDPLWNYAGIPAVQDSTDKTGALVLSFGNGTFATKPQQTDTITVAYAVTNGSTGNNLSFVNSLVTCALFSDVTGVMSTGLSGGGDQPSVSLYQRVGGDIFAGARGSVTSNQYTATALKYPGVIDAVVLAQRDLAPNNPQWFNVGKVILITQSPWTLQNKADFTTWFQARTMYSMRYQVVTGVLALAEEPRIKTIAVAANISCRQQSDLVQIQALATSAVQKVFAATSGTLGRNIYKTDITDAIKAVAPAQIDFVELALPLSDSIMNINPPILTAVVSAGTGSLAVGNFIYGVTAYDSDGETAPTLVTAPVLTAGSSVVLTWSSQAAALGYRVYGRSGNVVNIGSTQVGVNTFTDTGTATGTGLIPPSINTSGVHYAVLGTVSITASYSLRRSKLGS